MECPNIEHRRSVCRPICNRARKRLAHPGARRSVQTPDVFVPVQRDRMELADRLRSVDATHGTLGNTRLHDASLGSHAFRIASARSFHHSQNSRRRSGHGRDGSVARGRILATACSANRRAANHRRCDVMGDRYRHHEAISNHAAEHVFCRLATRAWRTPGSRRRADTGLANDSTISRTAAAALLYNMLIASLFCHWAWFKIATNAPASIAALSTMMIPVVRVFSGMLVLGEQPQWPGYLALVLVTLALATVLYPARNRT